MTHFDLTDKLIVLSYLVIVVILVQWFSRRENAQVKTGKHYFLANRSLPWWAVGTALIGANISAEQIIALSSDGFQIGLAVAAYEWGSAIILILIAKYLLPIFMQRGIYTLPQFLQQRYDYRIRRVLAVYWLVLYVFINLTAVLWFGANAMHQLTGLQYDIFLLFFGLLGIAYGTYGGLKPAAYTDVLQVSLVILGCSLLTYVALDKVAEKYQYQGITSGLSLLMENFDQRFNLILSPKSEHYSMLPGISTLLGGMLLLHISYWGFNQFIVQRALAAKSVHEGQKGLLLTAALKILMPFIIVLPGIAALVLLPEKSDSHYVFTDLIKTMPTGIKGLAVVALIAGVISSLAAISHAVATIFTLDLYAFGGREQDQANLVKVGRIVSVIAIFVAMITARPFAGDINKAFFHIQQLSGVMAPGIVAVFLVGILWNKASIIGAYAAVISSVTASLLFLIFLPTLPFLDRVLIVFALAISCSVLASILGGSKLHSGALRWASFNFQTTLGFKLWASCIVICVICIYASWW